MQQVIILYRKVKSKKKQALATTWTTYLKSQGRVMASGKVVVITGCSRGVGLGLVQEYAKRGWQVVATCRSPEKADQLKSIAQDRPDMKVFACDISTDESITTCVSAIRSSGISKVDLLINNAGVSNRDHPDDPASNTDRTEFNSIFNTNVAGPLSVTKAIPIWLRTECYAQTY